MSATHSQRTAEQKFADAMDLELDRQARRAYKRTDDEHWMRVGLAIEKARGLVRQRMSAEDRRKTT